MLSWFQCRFCKMDGAYGLNKAQWLDLLGLDLKTCKSWLRPRRRICWRDCGQKLSVNWILQARWEWKDAVCCFNLFMLILLMTSANSACLLFRLPALAQSSFTSVALAGIDESCDFRHQQEMIQDTAAMVFAGIPFILLLTCCHFDSLMPHSWVRYDSFGYPFILPCHALLPWSPNESAGRNWPGR